MIAPWDSSSFFYAKLLSGVLRLPELFLRLIWTTSSANDPISFASAFGRATATSICDHYGAPKVYLCAGSFVKSIIAGRYLLKEAIIFEHPTHNTSSRTRITVAQLLIHHPELFDIPHFIRFYYRYLHQVSSTLMIVVDNAMRLHLNRTRKLHATVAKATQSPYVSAILGVPVGHSSSSKTNSEIDCGGSSSVFNTFEGSKPRRTSVPSRIGHVLHPLHLVVGREEV
jgi:hypothetical protein